MSSSIPYWTILNPKSWYKYVWQKYCMLEIFDDFSQICEAQNLLLLILRQTNPTNSEGNRLEAKPVYAYSKKSRV